MKSMYFLISPNCNLSCKYCFQLNNVPEKAGSPNYHKQARVRADQKIVDQLVAYCLASGVTHVEIFGGEPLFYRELFSYTVKALCENVPNMSLGVITNGTLITEDIMRLFETLPISILLSLDGGRDRHNELRGGYDRISPWFDRLVAQGRVSVAVQAGRIDGLYQNVKAVWDIGFKNVYVNVIENSGWYSSDDVELFEREYEAAILGMLRGEGELNCAQQFYENLKHAEPQQGCGIVHAGLACDWHGLLYPCHRAMEIGTDFAIGSISEGVELVRAAEMRERIHREAFQSQSAAAYPMVSYCPVAIFQEHRNFTGAWSREYCEMIEIKAKLVAKHYLDLIPFMEPPPVENLATSASAA